MFGPNEFTPLISFKVYYLAPGEKMNPQAGRGAHVCREMWLVWACGRAAGRVWAGVAAWAAGGFGRGLYDYARTRLSHK